MQNLFDPSYLKYLCLKHGLTPSKRYGQNFLINPAPIEKMLDAAEISKKDTVVEVGPGFGVLTLALAERAGKVIAYEIEKKLRPYWEEQVKKYKNVEIVWGNILKIPNDQFPMTNYKIIANLPYQITSNVLRKFLEADPPAGGKPELMVLMVQKEVAERICARPGDMSLLAVSVQYFAEPEIITKVSRGNFWPEPKVDSAVIKLSLRAKSASPPLARSNPSQFQEIASSPVAPRNDNEQWFFKVAKAGFAQKRKLLVKNLEPLLDSDSRPFGAGRNDNKKKLEKIFIELGLSPQARAQELSVEQWMELSFRLRDPSA